MRSGPSIAATSCSTRRQRKRSGGPSGISASVSIGSGRSNSRSGRLGASARRVDRALPPARASPLTPGADERVFGNMRVDERLAASRGSAQSRAQPIEQIGELATARSASRARSHSRCEGSSGSAARHERRIRSTPKPASISSSSAPPARRSTKRRAIARASLSGRPAATRIRRTSPSTR